MGNKFVILFNFATRNRPKKCLEGIQNIISKVNDKDNYVILLSADTDDPTMYNPEMLRKLEQIQNDHNLIICWGKSEGKIHAINRGVEDFEYWDILVNFSDDMEFLTQGFDEIIREKFHIHFPLLDGNLHFNDGYTGEKLSTMSIMGKAFYDRFGYVYHPAYKSLFCDNEYTEVAQKLNKIQYFDQQIFVHNHPANDRTVEMDDQYRKNEALWSEDEKTYHRRRKLNFEL